MMEQTEKGMSLIEVMVASLILSLGILACLTLFSQSQHMLLSSRRFEIAQRVFAYGEMYYPIPFEVTKDPVDDDKLNVEKISAEELISKLDIEKDMSLEDKEDLSGYYYERTVDELDDEERDRNGNLYTIRTTVSWGGYLRGMKPEKETIITLWRNKNGGNAAKTSGAGGAK
jgi:prepilin-type N-terminal cleavage/methylation domain-containing protein